MAQATAKGGISDLASLCEDAGVHASSRHLLYPELGDAGRRLHHIPELTSTAPSQARAIRKSRSWAATALTRPPSTLAASWRSYMTY